MKTAQIISWLRDKAARAGDHSHRRMLAAAADRLEENERWIPVSEGIPQNFVSVLGYMTDAGEFPPVRECYTVGNAFFFPALADRHPVSHWKPIPKPPQEEVHT